VPASHPPRGAGFSPLHRLHAVAQSEGVSDVARLVRARPRPFDAGVLLLQFGDSFSHCICPGRLCVKAVELFPSRYFGLLALL